jgi:hypothetical protein
MQEIEHPYTQRLNHAMQMHYQEKNVDNQVEVECGEYVALCIIKLPQEYLHWCDDSGVEQQKTAYKEHPCQAQSLKRH